MANGGSQMNSNMGGLTCLAVCWALAGLAGLMAIVLLLVLGDWSLMQAIFGGAILTVFVGLLLVFVACGKLPHLSQIQAQTAGSVASAAPVAAPKPAAKPAAKAAAKPAAKSAAKPAAAKPAAKTAAKPAAKAAPTKAAAKPAAQGVRPAALQGPRDGKADDLKQIKGVGPQMEKLLNSLGFYHFDQIAGWTAKEVAWVDENLEGFKGRVTRDGWVKQAKTLAAGGETAFSKKVAKGGVY